MSSEITSWAERWGISPEAVMDLATVLTVKPVKVDTKTEAGVLGVVRLAASEAGWRLFRNNMGGVYNQAGQFIRYGLANESAPMNSFLKSSDLIGIRPVLITPGDVGRTIGQFAAIECKRPNWKFRPTNKREVAQQNFLALIASNGGYARFSTGAIL